MLRLVDLGIAEPSLIVPACEECNLLALDSIHTTFFEKRDFIRKSLTEKYSKLLNTNFSLDELIYEDDEIVIEKINLLRKKSKLTERLNHQHPYVFDDSLPKDSDYVVLNSKFIRFCPINGPNCLKHIPYASLKNLVKSKQANLPCKMCAARQNECKCLCLDCGASPNHTLGSCDNWLKKKYPSTCAICSSKRMHKARETTSKASKHPS
jgi:DNA-directed RNA polymerase subunit RPC12/RpoP